MLPFNDESKPRDSIETATLKRIRESDMSAIGWSCLDWLF
jgi:hypothetical protein